MSDKHDHHHNLYWTEFDVCKLNGMLVQFVSV